MLQNCHTNFIFTPPLAPKRTAPYKIMEKLKKKLIRRFRKNFSERKFLINLWATKFLIKIFKETL